MSAEKPVEKPAEKKAKEVPAPKPDVTPVQKKALFDKYEAVALKEKALDDQILAVREAKSAAIKEIEDMIGKGPFEWKGDVLIITKRENTYYFRSRGKTEVEKIG